MASQIRASAMLRMVLIGLLLATIGGLLAYLWDYGSPAPQPGQENALAATVAATMPAATPSITPTVRLKASPTPTVAVPPRLVASVVSAPANPSVQYGVYRITTIDYVVRSDDRGAHWVVILDGSAIAIPHDPTGCSTIVNAYFTVNGLAVQADRPRALYVLTGGSTDPGEHCGSGSGALGGLYFSSDGRSGFHSLSPGLPATYDNPRMLPYWDVVDLQFDPQAPSRFYVQVYAAFANGGYIGGNIVSASDEGIYRTEDGGAHWRAAFAGIPCEGNGTCSTAEFPSAGRPSGILAIDPIQPVVLLFVSKTGFYRSINSGARWRRTALPDNGGQRDPRFLLRIDPFAHHLAYLVTPAAIYTTTDSGLHLERITVPELRSPAQVRDISFSHSMPAMVTFTLVGGGHVAIQNR
jgi:hypothetical protein